MPHRHTDLLRTYGLARNPFNDRTAEKTGPLDDVSLFVPSDLRDFQPSNTTYVIFGRRGAGKTTIRLMMQRAYAEENAALRASGRSRGHLIADLSKPGHLTARLRAFQTAINATDDDWNAVFSENWTTADLVDSISSYVATSLSIEMSDPNSVEGQDMLRRAAAHPRAARQLLLLVHLYADCDSKTLAILRQALLKPKFERKTVALTAAITTTAVVGTGYALSRSSPEFKEALNAPFERLLDEIDDSAPILTAYPKVTMAAVASLCGAAAWATARSRRIRSLERAAKVLEPIRVVKHRPVGEIAALLDATFSSGDSAELIRSLCLGISAHQKLDHVSKLLNLLGYESLAIFGDCFDEVVLLDPVAYPGALKAFAKKACTNDFLNFGRIYFFFPDSRLALDLNTDRTLKEARFDRHHVRDLTWSRHQLEELAERRFLAAQLAAQRLAAAALGREGDQGAIEAAGHHHHHHAAAAAEAAVAAALSGNGGRPATFSDLFKDVKAEDFSSYLSKLSTPRELMIMMSELFARIESNPEGGVSGQDLEIATQRALEQAV
jgi:energy-coupling factor transporter ATP-binding protein EcfA2